MPGELRRPPRAGRWPRRRGGGRRRPRSAAARRCRPTHAGHGVRRRPRPCRRRPPGSGRSAAARRRPRATRARRPRVAPRQAGLQGRDARPRPSATGRGATLTRRGLGCARRDRVGSAQVERLGVEQLGPLLGHRAGQPAGAGRVGPRACGKRVGVEHRRPRPTTGRSVASASGRLDDGARPAAPPRSSYAREVDLLAAGVGGDHEVAVRPPRRSRPPRRRARPASTRRRPGLQHQRQRARGHQADPQPGEGARARRRPRSRSGPGAPGPARSSACAISGASCSPCFIGPLRAQLDDHVVAVVQGDGDERGGGVEGEQHGPRLAPGVGARAPTPLDGQPARWASIGERSARYARPVRSHHRMGLTSSVGPPAGAPASAGRGVAAVDARRTRCGARGPAGRCHAHEVQLRRAGPGLRPERADGGVAGGLLLVDAAAGQLPLPAPGVAHQQHLVRRARRP